ncbi:DEKNAAC102229 [Brettanomyces naardenensis]|uniref:Large ribosomal subunit protein mL49 n=1 Tax=Brettanomyces naardenensis TaxID=13370 RepID=A0A448YKP7_BRENA|nr:DEKNAAC102229 [Brettanomyces naardenensis]
MFTRSFVRLNSTLAGSARVSRFIPSLEDVSAKDLQTGIMKKRYFLERTSKGNLPIYKTYKSQAVYTEVKRVRGDIVQLRNDLQALLPDLDKKNFTCVMQSKTIRIKGDVSQQLKGLLEKEL